MAALWSGTACLWLLCEVVHGHEDIEIPLVSGGEGTGAAERESAGSILGGRKAPRPGDPGQYRWDGNLPA